VYGYPGGTFVIIGAGKAALSTLDNKSAVRGEYQVRGSRRVADSVCSGGNFRHRILDNAETIADGEEALARG
jgi:hypothetical protein